MTSRIDIPTVTGTFKTPDGADVTVPGFPATHFYARNSQSIVFTVRPTENLQMMEVTVTDQGTGEVRKYYFFNLTGGEYHNLLLDGLEPEHNYLVNVLMVDKGGNATAPAIYLGTSTHMAPDEIPPQITTRTVVSRTETMATLQIASNELLRKLKVQYRIVGTDEWQEQAIVETNDTFTPLLEGLQPGADYEYRCVLEDMSGNQLITDWESLAVQNPSNSFVPETLSNNLTFQNTSNTLETETFTGVSEYSSSADVLPIDELSLGEMIDLNLDSGTK